MRPALLQLFNDNYLNYTPDCSLEETEKSFKVLLDVPGIKKEDISIEVNNNMLVITGERKGAKNYTFERKFRLGDQASEDVLASLSDGVLTVEISKSEKAKARRIEIAVA